ASGCAPRSWKPLAMPCNPRSRSMSRVGWVSMIFISSMEVAGATQIGVADDGAGIAGRPGGPAVGDERGDALAGQPADLDGARRDCLGAFMAEIAIEPQNAQACPEALFGMGPAGQNGDDQPLGLRPDRGGPSAEARRCPLGISAMGTGHVLRVRAVTPPAIAALVNRNALAAVEDLDRPGRRANVDLLPDEAMRHRMEEGFELDVVVGGNADRAPFGKPVIRPRQAGQRRLFYVLEQMAAA